MNRIIKKGMLFIPATLMAFQSWAQDKKVDVNIDVNKKGSDWYQQPWVWVVGGAVFIIILVAMLKGSGKKE